MENQPGSHLSSVARAAGLGGPSSNWMGNLSVQDTASFEACVRANNGCSHISGETLDLLLVAMIVTTRRKAILSTFL